MILFMLNPPGRQPRLVRARCQVDSVNQVLLGESLQAFDRTPGINCH